MSLDLFARLRAVLLGLDASDQFGPDVPQPTREIVNFEELRLIVLVAQVDLMVLANHRVRAHWTTLRMIP
jgi:hypothetical protein